MSFGKAVVKIKKSPSHFCEGLSKKAAAYSPTWCSSTIGADGLNFPVRNGKGWAPSPWPPGLCFLPLGLPRGREQSPPTVGGINIVDIVGTECPLKKGTFFFRKYTDTK
jgi:hypothetical protein